MNRPLHASARAVRSGLFVVISTAALAACDAPPSGVDAGTDAGTLDSGPPIDASLTMTFAELGATSEGIALGQTPEEDWVLFVGTGDDRIVRVGVDGAVAEWASVHDPVGVTVRADGDLLVCGRMAPGGMDAPSVLFEVRPSMEPRVLVSAGPGGAPLGLCNFVAVAPDDSIVFSDSAGNRVLRADADGSNVALVTDAIQYPNGLAFSPDGATLYVASYTGGAVHALSFDRTTGTYGAPSVAVSDVSEVDGLVVTTDGDLLLVTSTSGILRATPGEAAQVLYGPRNFTVPANGVLANAAFEEGWLYLSSLGRRQIQRVFVGFSGVPLPVR